MIRVEEEKPKCEWGHCEHPPEDHDTGTCWHIVKPELADKPTLRKYCECSMDEQTDEAYGTKIQSIKSWADIERHEGKGWMEATPCPKCVKNEEKLPTGLILTNIHPRSKIGTPKECNFCFGKGTVDLMLTMECEKCKKVSLIRTDTKLCVACEEYRVKPKNYFTGKVIEVALRDATTSAIAAQKLFDEKEEQRKAKESKDHRNI